MVKAAQIKALKKFEERNRRRLAAKEFEKELKEAESKKSSRRKN